MQQQLPSSSSSSICPHEFGKSQQRHRSTRRPIYQKVEHAGQLSSSSTAVIVEPRLQAPEQRKATSENNDDDNGTCPANRTSQQQQSPLISQIDAITGTLRPYIGSAFKAMAARNPKNAKVLYSYVIAEQTEINIKDSTKEWKIKVLIWLSQYFEHQKAYQEMEKEDILLYLNSLRKQPSEDPDQRWIGTYNNRILAFSKFFRWLYNQDEPDYRKRPMPSCMKGVRRLPSKKKSSYKPSDMWTNEEHAIFLKHCPSARDRCYHAMAIDTSARPHEMLGLKIKDVHFKVSPDTGIQYAQITVSGKTGQRSLPLIDSLPYIKGWLGQHPFGNNPEAPLFVALADQNFGQQLSVNGIREQYQYQYKAVLFPRLLKEEEEEKEKEKEDTIPKEDKEIIQSMLAKPWNPYVYRHSSLTEMSKVLNEHTLRNHAGWTMGSKMPSVYVHYLGAESADAILAHRGIIRPNSQNHRDVLKPKDCPNCNEPNRPDSKFCMKCKLLLNPEVYEEIKGEEDRKFKEIREQFEQKLQAVEDENRQEMNRLWNMIQQNPELALVKPDRLAKRPITPGES